MMTERTPHADAPPGRYPLRIDMLLDERRAPDFTQAFDIVSRSGGATLGVGRYPGRSVAGSQVCYLKIAAADALPIVTGLTRAGYRIVAVHG